MEWQSSLRSTQATPVGAIRVPGDVSMFDVGDVTPVDDVVDVIAGVDAVGDVPMDAAGDVTTVDVVGDVISGVVAVDDVTTVDVGGDIIAGVDAVVDVIPVVAVGDVMPVVAGDVTPDNTAGDSEYVTLDPEGDTGYN
jgi:hypothetical protein